jgi:uncharacterized protein (DUF433 family)
MEFVFPDYPHIVVSQEICAGKPRIKGTRIPISSVMAYLASGMSIEDVLSEFNWITREDILQVLAFSANMLNDRIIPLEKAA